VPHRVPRRLGPGVGRRGGTERRHRRPRPRPCADRQTFRSSGRVAHAVGARRWTVRKPHRRPEIAGRHRACLRRTPATSRSSCSGAGGPPSRRVLSTGTRQFCRHPPFVGYRQNPCHLDRRQRGLNHFPRRSARVPTTPVSSCSQECPHRRHRMKFSAPTGAKDCLQALIEWLLGAAATGR
jgi:hypothetical protein